MKYDLQRLSELTTTPPRRIRYYIGEGLVPAPLGAGPGAHYRETHLLRLVLIRCMQAARGASLSDIRDQLAILDDDALRALLQKQGWSIDKTPPAPETPLPPDSALDYIRQVLHRREEAPSPSPPPRRHELRSTERAEAD